MKHNIDANKFYQLYLGGVFLIITLPIVAFSPWFFPPEWGKSIIFKIIFSFILLVLVWQIISGRHFFYKILQLYKSQKRIFQILFAILFILLLSTLFSLDMRLSLWGTPHRAGGSVIFSFYILFSIVLFLIVKNEDWKKILDYSFIIADLTVLFAMLQYFDVLPKILIDYTSRPPSTLSSPDLFALYLLLWFFLNVSSAIKETSKKKIFYWINTLLFAFGIIVSGSRAAYAGLLVGGLFFIFLYPIIKKSPEPAKDSWKNRIFKFISPQKIKILFATIALVVVAVIIFISIFPKAPAFIGNEPKLLYFYQRLSLKSAFRDLSEFRLLGWKIFWKAAKAKPILGWGPENISSGFDKYYDPKVPNLDNTWWDRAHTIFLDLAVPYGLLFTAIYFLFFAILFFKFYQIRKKGSHNALTIHALQATLIGYFIALLFGFDSVSTYIVLFFIVGYCLYIINESSEQKNASNDNENGVVSQKWFSVNKIKKPVIAVLLVLWLVFLWNYNLKPLAINAEINRIEDISAPTKSEWCQKVLDEFETLFDKKSFLDLYLRLKYVDHAQDCLSSSYDPKRMSRIIDALEYGTNIEPHYTRSWLLLGAFTNVLAANEKDANTKMELIAKAQNYLRKADELSPKRQETFKEWAKSYFVAEDFVKMRDKAKECVDGGVGMYSCHWYLGLSEILLGNETEGEKHLELARQNGYEYGTESSYGELAAVYTIKKNYDKLTLVYYRLLEFDPDNIQYHATLAFVYREMGDYKRAREEALKIIAIEPAMKDEVNEFLKTLPY